MDHAAIVSMLATRESIYGAIRQHSKTKDSPSLPTAPASDLHTLITVPDFVKYLRKQQYTCYLVDGVKATSTRIESVSIQLQSPNGLTNNLHAALLG